MNPSLISALSALAGAVIGGLMSLLASWVANQQQIRSQWLAHDRSRREDLYKEFIEEAANCYVDALLHERPDISSVVVLYAKVSRMRVISSREVVESAEQLISQIISTYSAPAKTFTDLQTMKYQSLDIIRNFSEQCRAEFDDLRAKHF
jgi:hypothetical protein